MINKISCYVGLMFFCGLFVMPMLANAASVAICFECHDKADFEDDFTHEPVAKSECTLCHNPHVAKYKGLLSVKTAALCARCHDDVLNDGVDKYVHEPAKNGECLACHNPHTSKNANLIKGTADDNVCFECHKSIKVRYAYTHEPFAEGDCVACHNPHSSQQNLLLAKEVDELCRDCHDPDDLKVGHKNFPTKLGRCLTCHNPHGSKNKFLIRNFSHAPYEEDCSNCHDGDKKITSEKCFECHEDVKTQFFTVHNHLTSKTGNACLTCHSPHTSDYENLLKNSQVQICQECHADTIQRIKESLYSHKDTGSCTDCHSLHGSNAMVLLNGNGIEVCARCHETQGNFTHPVGEGVKDPRNGQIITCVTCHYPHGTDFKNNLKLEGSQDLCVQCHKTY